MKEIRIGQVGHGWIGRAHAHAYTDVPIFFDIGMKVIKQVLCADQPDVHETARRWGFTRSTMNWQDIIDADDVDIVVIAAPSAIHKDVAIAAARAGKHVFCEKPLALSLEDAEEMTRIANDSGVTNMIGFNFRRVPALALARKLIANGELGDIRHFRGIYQQDWLTDEKFPLVWRLKKAEAGYGSHGDLGAHVIDTARFLIGDIDRVVCQQETFVRERPVPASGSGITASAGSQMGQVDVDDASSIMCRFNGRNTLGYIEVSRYGAGHRNQNRIEVNGSKGSLIFDMEQMNELEYYSTSDRPDLQGYRKIQVGEAVHPYTANWWPAGHIIGFGDTFVNEAYDFLVAVKEGKNVTPDFNDGLACQRVLEAADRSAGSENWEKL